MQYQISYMKVSAQQSLTHEEEKKKNSMYMQRGNCKKNRNCKNKSYRYNQKEIVEIG